MINVKITNYTHKPIETVINEWKSTHQFDNRSIDDLWDFISKSNLPILESISFNFRIENAPIAWREQLVRNRHAAYWIQSGRETIVDKVFDNQLYFIPDSINNNSEALKIYKNHWKLIQENYNKLIELGIDPGDARLIVGSGQTHLVNFYTDYRNLINIVGNRMCHIAQASLWKDIIKGIVEELKLIDTRLIKPLMPKCFINNKCLFDGINKTRLNTEKGLLNKDNGGDFSGSHCPRWEHLNEIANSSSNSI